MITLPPNTARTLGALGNGITDDTVAIQNGINQAIATGQEFDIEPGTYRISKSLVIDSAPGSPKP